MLSPFHTLISERNSQAKAEQLTKFADLYYSGAPDDEILARPVEDLYGAALSSWQFIQQREPGVPKVRVFNPDHENHGWQSSHTVIEIVYENMPFLIDSIRIHRHDAAQADASKTASSARMQTAVHRNC